MRIARVLLTLSTFFFLGLFLILFVSYASAWPFVLSLFAPLLAGLIILWVKYLDEETENPNTTRRRRTKLLLLVLIWPLFFVLALTVMVLLIGPVLVEEVDPDYEAHFLDILVYLMIALLYAGVLIILPWAAIYLAINIYRNARVAYCIGCARESLRDTRVESGDSLRALAHVTGCFDGLHVALLKYTRSSEIHWRPIEFGLTRFRQDVDVVFSCIAEALWNDYYQTHGRMPMSTLSTSAHDSETLGNLPRLTPERLLEWISGLDDALFAFEGRLTLPNNTTMSKLKSFIRRTREVLEKSRYKEICENQVNLVSQYHEKRELVSSQRKDVVVGLARQVLIAVTSAAIGIFFGTQIA